MLAMIVKYIVTNEDDIRIQREEDEENWITLTLTCHKDDVWRIIWKQWKVVWSMRTLLRVLWAKLEKRISLTIVEPDKL
jgi:predicted RNA-binding protein YlqC (UPF0109 family)